MLAIGTLTRFAGVDATLGLAFAGTGILYPFFGTLLGWLGVALTGSDTASNVLFGGLQKITSGQLGLSPILMGAANSSGGVMGKMIDAQSIVVLANAYWLTGRGPDAVGKLAQRAIDIDAQNRGAWHLHALSESDPRARMERWRTVATRFPTDLLARAALADNAASVAGAEHDPLALDLADREGLLVEQLAHRLDEVVEGDALLLAACIMFAHQLAKALLGELQEAL